MWTKQEWCIQTHDSRVSPKNSPSVKIFSRDQNDQIEKEGDRKLKEEERGKTGQCQFFFSKFLYRVKHFAVVGNSSDAAVQVQYGCKHVLIGSPVRRTVRWVPLGLGEPGVSGTNCEWSRPRSKSSERSCFEPFFAWFNISLVEIFAEAARPYTELCTSAVLSGALFFLYCSSYLSHHVFCCHFYTLQLIVFLNSFYNFFLDHFAVLMAYYLFTSATLLMLISWFTNSIISQLSQREVAGGKERGVGAGGGEVKIVFYTYGNFYVLRLSRHHSQWKEEKRVS